MIILAHGITDLKNGSKEHAIVFEFENKSFEALVVETADETYVSECLYLKEREITEIDIPEFFGKGFSSEVYSLLYGRIEKLEKKEQ